jgi:hypothetical protein
MNFGERPKPSGFTGTHSLMPHLGPDQPQIAAVVPRENYAITSPPPPPPVCNLTIHFLFSTERWTLYPFIMVWAFSSLYKRLVSRSSLRYSLSNSSLITTVSARSRSPVPERGSFAADSEGPHLREVGATGLPTVNVNDTIRSTKALSTSTKTLSTSTKDAITQDNNTIQSQTYHQSYFLRSIL